MNRDWLCLAEQFSKDRLVQAHWLGPSDINSIIRCFFAGFYTFLTEMDVAFWIIQVFLQQSLWSSGQAKTMS